MLRKKIRLRLEKKAATKKKTPGAQNVVRQNSRAALRATSLAAAVAQNGYFNPNVAPAQQRNSATAN